MSTIRNTIAMGLLLLGSGCLSAQVTVYENNNYGGKSYTYTEGEFHLAQTIGDNVLSSVKVTAGWKITIQEHGIGRTDRGKSVVLTADAPELASKNFDNVGSTVIVERINTNKTCLYVGEVFPAPGKGTKQTMVSPNGKYILAAVGSNFFTFKNEGYIPYGPDADKKGIARIGKSHYSNTRLVLQEDGNLVILANVQGQPAEVIWASSTVPSGDPRFNDATLKPVKLCVGNDGAFELYNARDEKVWYDNTKE